MPKYWNYDIGDKVEVVKMPAYDSHLLNLTGVIEEFLDSPTYDYVVRFDETKSTMKFKEDEINKLNNFKSNQTIMLKATTEIGIIKRIDNEHRQLEIKFWDGSMAVYGFDQVEICEGEATDMEVTNQNSVKHILEIYLAHYKNDDSSYTIPEELLKNILSQIYEVAE